MVTRSSIERIAGNDIAEFSIKKNVITWTLTVVLLLLGYLAYQNLSRLEDPEFVIKDAVIVTPYPGASPDEVEKEVTEKIEKAVQELGQLQRVESYSARGLSTVKVTIQDSSTRPPCPRCGTNCAARSTMSRGSCRPAPAPHWSTTISATFTASISPSPARAIPMRS